MLPQHELLAIKQRVERSLKGFEDLRDKVTFKPEFSGMVIPYPAWFLNQFSPKVAVQIAETSALDIRTVGASLVGYLDKVSLELEAYIKDKPYLMDVLSSAALYCVSGYAEGFALMNVDFPKDCIVNDKPYTLFANWLLPTKLEYVRLLDAIYGDGYDVKLLNACIGSLNHSMKVVDAFVSGVHSLVADIEEFISRVSPAYAYIHGHFYITDHENI